MTSHLLSKLGVCDVNLVPQALQQECSDSCRIKVMGAFKDSKLLAAFWVE
jgi:hypothetical protein